MVYAWTGCRGCLKSNSLEVVLQSLLRVCKGGWLLMLMLLLGFVLLWIPVVVSYAFASKKVCFLGKKGFKGKAIATHYRRKDQSKVVLWALKLRNL